jgi:hypothetical protein
MQLPKWILSPSHSQRRHKAHYPPENFISWSSQKQFKLYQNLLVNSVTFITTMSNFKPSDLIWTQAISYVCSIKSG